jgi:hypothetical protein
MISPKLAVLTAFMAVSSMGAIPALAQDTNDVDNVIAQSISQSNEACTNTAVNIADADSEAASVFGDADSEAEAEANQDADQSNKCKVDQSNEAEQEAEIDNESVQEILDIFL